MKQEVFVVCLCSAIRSKTVFFFLEMETAFASKEKLWVEDLK